MKKTTWLMPALTVFLSAAQLSATAQDTTKTEKPVKEYKNTFRFNLTNPVIFGTRSLIFGYERVVSKHQTFSVNFGQTGFPSLNIIDSDSLKANKVTDQKGFNFSADYRFYLAKENKYAAPRGVYIGPYYSYNNFEKKHSWSLTSTAGGPLQTVESTTSLKVNAVGIEAGYQFILWDRLALDMILSGPGIAVYNLKASLGTNLSEQDKQKFFEKLNEALEDKFPGYSWAIDEGEFQTKGSASTTRFGYRCMIHIGYRF